MPDGDRSSVPENAERLDHGDQRQSIGTGGCQFDPSGPFFAVVDAGDEMCASEIADPQRIVLSDDMGQHITPHEPFSHVETFVESLPLFSPEGEEGLCL